MPPKIPQPWLPLAPGESRFSPGITPLTPEGLPDYSKMPPGSPIRQITAEEAARISAPLAPGESRVSPGITPKAPGEMLSYWGAQGPIRQITEYEGTLLDKEIAAERDPYNMAGFEEALQNKLERRINPFASEEKSGVDKAAAARAAQAQAMQAAMQSISPQQRRQMRPIIRPAFVGDYGLGKLAKTSQEAMQMGRERRKKTLGALTEAQEQQELALDAQAEAQIQRYKKVGEAKSGAVQAYQQAEQQMTEMRQRQAQAQKNFETKISDARLGAQYALMPIEQVKKHQAIIADPDVDPKRKAQSQAALENASRASDKRSVGTRVLGALAMMFGGAASAYTGGPNQAMQLIQSSIDRDIQSQREQFARARGRVKGLDSDFARNMRIFGDEKLAILETQRQKLGQVDAKVDQMTSMMHGPEAAARRELIKGQLAQQNALIADKIQQLGEGQEMQSISQQTAIAGQRLQRGMANQRAQIAQAQQAQGRGTTDIQGLVKTGQVTQKQSDSVRTAVSSKRKLDSLIDEMIELQNKYTLAERLKDKVSQSKVGAQLAAKGGTAMNLLRKATGAGAALTPEEQKFMDPEGVLTDPKKLFGAKIQLQAIKEASSSGFESWLQANNYALAPKQTPVGFRPR
jgi:hypothetical protein